MVDRGRGYDAERTVAHGTGQLGKTQGVTSRAAHAAVEDPGKACFKCPCGNAGVAVDCTVDGVSGLVMSWVEVARNRVSGISGE
ncbi:hypothetical protein DBB29_13720 [Pandoraea cepalis]|uniref:Transposase n=1 Tax=Pandoraea cepalis TaxID=2508294 RepID=A0AAW7MQZ3_9BURK|nr:hypothetical protein [Pandoraea cepalis]MDN4579174.1 hypothetical protein [Pandoraea cepalis]